jgi:hypothetical protein
MGMICLPTLRSLSQGGDRKDSDVSPGKCMTFDLHAAGHSGKIGGALLAPFIDFCL